MKRYTLRPDSFLARLLKFLPYCRLPLLIIVVLLFFLLLSQLIYTGISYLFPRVRVVDWGMIGMTMGDAGAAVEAVLRFHSMVKPVYWWKKDPGPDW